MGISLLDVAEIGGLPVWGESYDEHIPSPDVVEENELLKSVIEVLKFMLAVITHQHNHKLYVPLVDWAEEFFVNSGSSSSSKSRSLYADSEDLFECIREDEGHVVVVDYDIPYNCVGKEFLYTDELFLAATIVHWLCSFIFPSQRDQ